MKQPFNLETLSNELKQYLVQQDYDLYTWIDQASWRYIMRVNQQFFSKNAHPKYLDGLKKTGIPTERIPRIEEMDECLQRFGWRAVAVSGFIPPAVFLELQAKGILTIACDMRSIEHIAYTPAPDIVHEAAGHAPIIADESYSNYLRQYGEISAKAIFSKEDLDVYEAIRNLSIVKEDPKSTLQDIEQAQKLLDEAASKVTYTSEATMLSRMAWWTIEYGLIGSSNKPVIYGAGLLSSAGESYNCLQENVAKIPFSIDCTQVSYDITKPQPQLFVTPDFQTLSNVIEEFSQTMAFRKGGMSGLAKAKMARTVTTTELDSGVQIGGILEELVGSSNQSDAYLRYSGPSQLAYKNVQLQGHGPKYHSHGYGTPLGRVKGLSKPLSNCNDQELASIGIKLEQSCHIEYESGVLVKGVLKSITRKDSRLLLLTFDSATVTLEGRVLFDPSWGIYDMACGQQVISVYGGAPDRGSYFDEVGVRQPSGKAKTNLTEANQQLNQWYHQVRTIRESVSSQSSNPKLEAQLEQIFQNAADAYSKDWLLALEILELACKLELAELKAKTLSYLQSFGFDTDSELETKTLINRGLSVLKSSGLLF